MKTTDETKAKTVEVEETGEVLVLRISEDCERTLKERIREILSMVAHDERL